MFKKLVSRLVLILLLSLGTINLSLAGTENFLSLADIHFDAFISCQKKPCPLIQQLREAPADQWDKILSQNDHSKARYGKDTNYPLLISALAAAKEQAQESKPQFVLVLGDLLGHDNDFKYRKFSGDKTKAGYRLFVKKTLAFMSSEFKQAFPHLNVYWVVGNNDTYQQHYYLVPNGAFFKDMGVISAGLLPDEESHLDLLRAFPQGGYYAVQAPHQSDLRLIFLNSVFFSLKAQGPGINQAASKELDWLHQQLAEAKAKKQRVLIAMHIPTGLDIYTSLFIPINVLNFWKKPYTQRFMAELKQYADEIMGVFTGHIHVDAYEDYTVDHQKSIPFASTPSISPIFGNNPGFNIYSYSQPALRLLDYTDFYRPLNGGAWEKRSAANKQNAQYGLTPHRSS